MQDAPDALPGHEIAAKLVVSDHTAKTHVADILQKLDLRDRIQAVVLAYGSRLVTPGAGDEPRNISHPP